MTQPHRHRQSPSPPAPEHTADLLRTYTVTVNGPVRQTRDMIWDFAVYGTSPIDAAGAVMAVLHAEFSNPNIYPPGQPPTLSVTQVAEGLVQRPAPHYLSDMRHTIVWQLDVTWNDQTFTLPLTTMAYAD